MGKGDDGIWRESSVDFKKAATIKDRFQHLPHRVRGPFIGGHHVVEGIVASIDGVVASEYGCVLLSV